MDPKIDNTHFGSITIEDQKYPHDVLIRMGGKITKRKKKLSKQVYGTSHMLSKAEAHHVFEEGLETLIIGTGQFDRVRLSEEAQAFFDESGVEIILAGTPKAMKMWNQAEGKVVGLFLVTC